MIFSEKTFSRRCQLQIHDGVATLVFWLPFWLPFPAVPENEQNLKGHRNVIDVF